MNTLLSPVQIPINQSASKPQAAFQPVQIPIEHQDEETDAALRVIIVYEDYTMGERAMEVYARLARHFAGDIETKCNLWRFDTLQVLFLRDIAAAEAAKADLIVFSAHAECKPNSAFKKWIAGWLPQKMNQECAMVVLSDRIDSEESTTPIQTYLRRIARRVGAAFFSVNYLPTARLDLMAPARIVERTLNLFPTMNEVVRKSCPAPHWGINE